MIIGKCSSIKGFFLFLIMLIALLVLVKLCVVGGTFNIILGIVNAIICGGVVVYLYRQWSCNE